MAKKRKMRARGRPRTTETGTLVGVRVHKHFLARMDHWRARQEDKPSRADAIQRLAEWGLGRAERARPARDRSADMAGKTIDRLTDPSVSAEDQAKRKRRLLKGPEEFRGLRDDQGSE